MTKYIVSGLYAATCYITNQVLGCWDCNNILCGQRGCLVNNGVSVRPAVLMSSYTTSIIIGATARYRTEIKRLYVLFKLPFNSYRDTEILS